MKETSEEKLSILKKKYVGLCCQPRLHAIKDMQDQIAGDEESIHKYQRVIVEKVREVEFKKVALEALKVPQDMRTKEIEFDHLITHPDIDNIAVDGEHIVVFTNQIDIEHKGVIYDIGKFIINLSTTGGNKYMVRFKNTVRNIGDGRPHPHVDVDGLPCLGNIKECLPQMIGSHQYTAAISVAIQYLKSYTDNEHGKPYCYIARWPVKRHLQPEADQLINPTL